MRAGRKVATPVPALKRPRTTGRRTVLTAALQAEICGKVAEGASLKDAATTSGVHEATVHRWLADGARQEQGPLREFRESIAQAKAERRQAFKAMIRRAAKGTAKTPGDWRAARALGAITDPQDFVPQIRLHIANELEAALDRLRDEFKSEPEIYERALLAMSGGLPAEATPATQSRSRTLPHWNG